MNVLANGRVDIRPRPPDTRGPPYVLHDTAVRSACCTMQSMHLRPLPREPSPTVVEISRSWPGATGAMAPTEQHGLAVGVPSTTNGGDDFALSAVVGALSSAWPSPRCGLSAALMALGARCVMRYTVQELETFRTCH